MDRNTRRIRFFYLASLAAGLTAIAGMAWGLRALQPLLPVMAAAPLMWLLPSIGFLAFVCAVSLPFAGATWRLTDEAAREAQKTAVFWGGSFGAVLGLAGLCVANSLAVREQFIAGAWRPGEFPHTDIMPMIHGAVIVLLAQMAGALIVWAFWWMRRSPDSAHSQTD